MSTFELIGAERTGRATNGTAPVAAEEPTQVAEELLRRIRTGEAVIGVIGLGYVGLPLAHALHGGGLQILGFDVDERKIRALAAGESYLKHLGEDMTRTLSQSPRFSATSNLSRLGEADVIIVCVPTPLGKHQEPDLAYVINSARAIGRSLRPGQLIILESTTYPGTTRHDFLPAMLEAAAEPTSEAAKAPLFPGTNIFVAFSPEREDPGRTSHTTKTTPKLVGGLDAASTDLAYEVYSKALEHVIRVSSAEIAESAKLLENIFRAVNIAMVNEMKVVLTAMGIDVWEVIQAASTKPFGFMPFYPGPGLGGHCIPIDPFYLTWKAREFGRPTRFIELAGEINTSMPHYVIERLASALNNAGKPVRGTRILVLGLAYKADIDDTRESPSFELVDLLRGLGASVDYSDPLVPIALPVRKHELKMASVDLTPRSLASYDAVLIATAHRAFQYELIARHSKLVVDTRNAMAPYAAEMGDRLVKT